jgi:peptide/nickel transport system substrate-binding protein
MKKRTVFILFMILALIGSILLAGCSKPDNNGKQTSTEAQKQVEVIKLSGGDSGYLSPYTHAPHGGGGSKMELIFDSLLEKDENGFVPWLAEKYEIKDNGKNYLFTIRDGIKWHDGQPLTVEDVKFTFEYASKYPMVWSYISSDFFEKIEIIGKNQVQITVAKPSAPILENLVTTRIIPKHIWENVDNPKEYVEKEAVIGCGPYMLTDYSKEHGTYRLEAFKDYWGPKQRIKVIEFVPVSQDILAFEQGEVDMARITPDVLSRFQNDPQCKIYQRPPFTGDRLLFNMGDNPVFQNKEMRQAFCYAINKNELVEKIQRGAGIPGNAGILPPKHIMYNPNVKKYDHNIKKSEEMLDKLGYDKKDANGIRQNANGEKLSFDLLVGESSVRSAEVIKEQLGKVGINLKVQSVDIKTRDARVREHKYQLAIMGHGNWGRDADYLRERFAGLSKGGMAPDTIGVYGYKNDKLNELLEQQNQTFDNKQRKKLVFQIQEILAEDVPEIPLVYSTGYTVYKPAKYDGWMCHFDHHTVSMCKLSYLERK